MVDSTKMITFEYLLSFTFHARMSSTDILVDSNIITVIREIVYNFQPLYFHKYTSGEGSTYCILFVRPDSSKLNRFHKSHNFGFAEHISYSNIDYYIVLVLLGHSFITSNLYISTTTGERKMKLVLSCSSC